MSSHSGRLFKTCNSNEQKSIKTKFQVGDVLFGKLRPYLRKFYMAQFDGVCTTEIWVLRSNSVPSNFLYQIIQSHFFSSVANIQSGTKMPRSDWSIVSQSIFKIPPDYNEQQKISAFLSVVDTRLEQLNRKKTLWAQYKKGMMQKLFSQEIRFKDDAGKDYPDWAVKKLGNIGEVITGKTPSTANKSLWDGELQFITPTDINDEEKYQASTERHVKRTKHVKELPPKSIIYTCIASIGKMCISVKPCTTNQQINSLIPTKNYDSDFIYYSLLKITPRIKETQATTTLPIINKTAFEKIRINIPSLKEQQKIAEFLSAIDRKIELVADQLEQDRTFKKGLLQQMFI